MKSMVRRKKRKQLRIKHLEHNKSVINIHRFSMYSSLHWNSDGFLIHKSQNSITSFHPIFTKLTILMSREISILNKMILNVLCPNVPILEILSVATPRVLSREQHMLEVWQVIIETLLRTATLPVDETTNGTEDIWWILEGWGYPRL